MPIVAGECEFTTPRPFEARSERILAGALRKGTVIEKALDRKMDAPLLW